jgi:hypothetical protein
MNKQKNMQIFKTEAKQIQLILFFKAMSMNERGFSAKTLSSVVFC